MTTVGCSIIGSGNIGSDLMYKLQGSSTLDLKAVVGIDPTSEGLARARSLGLRTSHDGISWLLERHADLGVQIVFDATSAKVHARHAPLLEQAGLTAIDLTPAARGPAVVPTVNLGVHVDASNVNLITCGGQATIPIVAAVSRVCPVPYAEIVSTVASVSAGPGTRSNIDEFTRATASGLESLAGAACGKAIILLNPADPPILMRNTVYCGLPDDADLDLIRRSIEEMVQDVAAYVPGYRLRAAPIFDEGPYVTPSGPVSTRVTALLEVEGAGDYLPTYAGNLDIMTACAVRVGELVAQSRLTTEVSA